ncbi:hypothetical protein FJY70_01700 [candidate division WOR-3 bacterium]|nr:hypothetical protein [candidate division WOR-3 bacterium]
MRNRAAFAVILAALLIRAALGYEEVTVGVGEQKIVTVPPRSDITFTGPLHISRLDSRRVKIIGDAPGWGSVTVTSGTEVTQYSVTVVAVPPEQTIAKLRSLLAGLNLTYAVAGGQVVIEGRVETSRDLERFNRVMEMYPGVVNMAVVTAKEPLIDIAVTLVEVEVDNASSLGLLDVALPTGQGRMAGTFPLSDIIGGKVKASDIQVSFVLSSQLLEALSAQIEGGRARIIANPRIVTLNRKEAVIQSGGEIPYRVVSATGAQGVEYKPYGLKLTVTPEDRANDVVLQFNLESSEPIGAVSSASENPLTTRSVDLSIAVEKDRTLIIAGLYNAVTSRATRAGCLFPLFASAASTRRREIIVLVTPRVTFEGINQDYFEMVKPKDLKR